MFQTCLCPVGPLDPAPSALYPLAMIGGRFYASFALLVLTACAQRGEDVDISEGALLPNGTTVEAAQDVTAYSLIADRFAAAGSDLHVDLTSLSPAWPLDDTKKAVLSRFGTPIQFR